MPLHENHVPRLLFGIRTPEMIEAHLVQRGRRCVTGNVAAVLGAFPIRAHYHRHRIPANIGLNAALQRTVSRVLRLPCRRDRIEIGGVRRVRQVSARAPRIVDHVIQQKVRTFGAVLFEYGVNRLQPLGGFYRVNIVKRIKLSHSFVH